MEINIPEYPELRDIEFEDKDVFEQLFKEYPPEISEFTFTNLFSWRKPHSLKISAFRGCILICSREGERHDYFEPLGPEEDKEHAIKNILENEGTRIIRVSENISEKFKEDSDIIILEDADNSDYVYLVDDLSSLKGKKYDAKRNHIKKFKANNDFQYFKLSNEHVNECLNFEDKWCDVKGCDFDPGLKSERDAYREMFNNFKDMDLMGAAIRIQGTISAVVLAEALNEETIVLHIQKARLGMQGLYQTMNNEFLSRECADYKYLNMEQDLGVEGLRRAKQSYHPVRMVRKFTLARGSGR